MHRRECGFALRRGAGSGVGRRPHRGGSLDPGASRRWHSAVWGRARCRRIGRRGRRRLRRWPSSRGSELVSGGFRDWRLVADGGSQPREQHQARTSQRAGHHNGGRVKTVTHIRDAHRPPVPPRPPVPCGWSPRPARAATPEHAPYVWPGGCCRELQQHRSKKNKERPPASTGGLSVAATTPHLQQEEDP